MPGKILYNLKHFILHLQPKKEMKQSRNLITLLETSQCCTFIILNIFNHML